MEWTSTWANSGKWWGTGRPGVLHSTGSWRAGHDWETEKQLQLPGHTDKYRDVVLLTLQVRDHLNQSSATFPLSPHFLPSTTSFFSSTRGEFISVFPVTGKPCSHRTFLIHISCSARSFFFFCSCKPRLLQYKSQDGLLFFPPLVSFLSLHLSLKAINKHRMPSCLFGVESCTKTMKEGNTG